MRRRAAKIDANQTAIVDALRKIGCKVLSLASVGKGVPDLLVGVRHLDGHGPAFRLLLLEVKSPKQISHRGEPLTPDQVAFHAAWAGSPIVVVESVEQAIAAVRS